MLYLNIDTDFVIERSRSGASKNAYIEINIKSSTFLEANQYGFTSSDTNCMTGVINGKKNILR